MANYKPYPKYKDSGIPWLGEIPEHWEVRKLKYLFGLVTLRTDEILPKVGLENIQGWTGKFLKTGSNFEGDGEVFEKDDILFGKLRPYLAKVYLAEFKGKAVGDIFVLRAASEYSKHYGRFLLVSKKFIQLVSSSVFGAKMPRVSWDFLCNQYLPFPPKEEQTAIARFLDYKLAKINRFIQKKKQLIKLLNEQKAAIINQAVTKGIKSTDAMHCVSTKMKDSGIEWLGEIPEHWEVRKLKYVANCFPSNVDKHSNENEKQVRLCNYTDVYKNDYITDSMDLMLATATDEQIKKFTLLQGDVIITKDSETANDIAVPAYVKEPLTNVVCGYHLSVLRPYETLYGEFLFRVLQCKEINIQFEVRSNGVTRVGLGVYDLKNAKIPVPPINEQTEIVEYIFKETSTIYTTISTIEKEIALVEEYKTALIAEAVTGKIDVRGYEIPEITEEDFDYAQSDEMEIEEEISMAAEEGLSYDSND